MKVFEIKEFGLDNLSVTQQDVPEPRGKQVLIRFRAASLNYRDLMVVGGTYNPRMKLPAVPLSDGAGEVAAVGPDVRRWKVGDRVCPIFVQGWLDGEIDLEKSRTALGAGSQWNGVLREYGTFDEESVVRIPDHLSFEEAATLPCAAVTAWHALAVSGKMMPGETVLTLGTGGLSMFALQLAKLFNGKVIATTGSAEKESRLREAGADEVINYRSEPDWDRKVLELTGKRGVDHVIEVGGAGTLQRSVSSVRLGGHIALIGALDREGQFNHVPVFMKLIRMQGIFVGSRKMFEDVSRAIEAVRLRPIIDKVFTFDEAADALRYMESGSHFGKIVISY